MLSAPIYALQIMVFDGHELSMLGTTAGLYSVCNACLPRGWVKTFIHRHPAAALGTVLGLTGILLPVVVVPIRRSLGLPTNQYDAHHPNVVFPKYE